jgi:uncharacterized membrane protein
MSGFFAMYAVYSLSRFRQFDSAGYDLGIFDQAIRAYSRFHAPLVALKGADYNILGDHFHPILVVLAPLYWVWDDPRVLLIAQALLVAASIPIIYSFAQRHRLNRGVASAISVAYAIGWPLQGMLDFDFHEIAFAVPLLACAVDALDRRDDRRLLICAALLVLTREDLGLVVVVLGALRFARAPRRTGLILGVLGFVGFVFATSFVLPHFAPHGKFAYWSYDALGPNLASGVRTLVLHPVRAANVFFTPSVKTRTLAWLFLPLLLLPLRSPYVVLSVPLLAERFFSSRPNLWTTEFHYSSVLWPILVLAAIDGAGRLRLHKLRLAWPAVATALVAIQLVGTVQNSAQWPLQRLFTGEAFFFGTRMRDQQAVVARIEAGTCADVDDRLAPHLTHSNLVSLPTVLHRRADYIALDLAQASVGFELPAPDSVLAEALADGYVSVLRRGDVVLLQRPDFSGPTEACRP